MDDDSVNIEDESIILNITNACVTNSNTAFEHKMEKNISELLSIRANRTSVIIDDNSRANNQTITIVLHVDENSKENRCCQTLKEEQIINKINEYINNNEDWLGNSAHCSIAEDEEDISIDEEDAIKLWHEMSDRTSHLELISNPDGIMIMPTHEEEDKDIPPPTNSQLKRDPTLLEYDNVQRIHASQINNINNWDVPIIITGAKLQTHALVNKDKILELFGSVEVRTGNRNTLIESGFMNSKPMAISQALNKSNQEYNCFVFTPISELPQSFQSYLDSLISAFPSYHEENKYTLCIANEGFGIGMHKHNKAMFMLLEGRKKWYMASSKVKPTHPGFYTCESSHQCIQEVGEILLVPHDWYHEIFNLSYTFGIQSLSV